MCASQLQGPGVAYGMIWAKLFCSATTGCQLNSRHSLAITSCIAVHIRSVRTWAMQRNGTCSMTRGIPWGEICAQQRAVLQRFSNEGARVASAKTVPEFMAACEYSEKKGQISAAVFRPALLVTAAHRRFHINDMQSEIILAWLA